MLIRELIDIVDDAIANVKVAIVSSQQRVFESPHTSWEFTQRSLELENELDRLKKIKEYLLKFEPEEIAEKIFSEEELRELLRYLESMKEMRAHEF
ncbi:hypothetical protein [Thermococcus sp.]